MTKQSKPELNQATPTVSSNDSATKQSFFKKPQFLFFAGLLLGALLILGIRFVTYTPMHHTHYHANFALYINGVREEFKDKKYYEDVAICSAETGITEPAQRAHMHENINSVVHVHDEATTWGQFFENLGWYVGPDFIQTADGTLYKADGTSKLHVLINGQDYTDLTPITNQVIGSKDRVLISFGDISQSELNSEAKSVASTAAKYNETMDPASCSGGHGDHVTVKQRFENLF